jgi:probable F420-dependent oxidoreductase
MLALARDRTLGAHPHLVTPEYSAMARAILGPDRLLVPKQGVVFESDPQRARDMTRAAITHHRKLPNYANNWRRMGFSEADIADLSDRLIDALFAWGSADRIVERIRAHQAAGADHVCVQVITGADTDIGPLRALWRELAAALL